MAWLRAVSHTGTGAGWHDPEGAYQEAGYAWHDIISGHWSIPGFTDWSDWLQLQFDGTYASTSVKWYVSWIYRAPPQVGLHLQYQVYTGSWELVSEEVPAFPSWVEITFSERNISAMRIRYGSGISFPRNQIEPRVHDSAMLIGIDVLAPTGIVSAEAFGTPAIAAVKAALGRTYFFLA